MHVFLLHGQNGTEVDNISETNVEWISMMKCAPILWTFWNWVELVKLYMMVFSNLILEPYKFLDLKGGYSAHLPGTIIWSTINTIFVNLLVTHTQENVLILYTCAICNNVLATDVQYNPWKCHGFSELFLDNFHGLYVCCEYSNRQKTNLLSNFINTHIMQHRQFPNAPPDDFKKYYWRTDSFLLLYCTPKNQSDHNW